MTTAKTGPTLIGMAATAAALFVSFWILTGLSILLADVVAVIGTQDIVFGEVDR